MSKPNGCPGARPCRLFASSQNLGSTEVNNRGTAAIVKKPSSSREQPTNCGLRSSARSSSVLDSVRPSASSCVSAPTTAWTSDIAHPRVQDAVQEVDEQVDQDERDERQGRQQDHDTTLLQLDRLEHELPEPGQVENALGEDRATEHACHVDPDEGDHGQQRVR